MEKDDSTRYVSSIFDDHNYFTSNFDKESNNSPESPPTQCLEDHNYFCRNPKNESSNNSTMSPDYTRSEMIYGNRSGTKMYFTFRHLIPGTGFSMTPRTGLTEAELADLQRELDDIVVEPKGEKPTGLSFSSNILETCSVVSWRTLRLDQQANFRVLWAKYKSSLQRPRRRIVKRLVFK